MAPGTSLLVTPLTGRGQYAEGGAGVRAPTPLFSFWPFLAHIAGRELPAPVLQPHVALLEDGVSPGGRAAAVVFVQYS